MFSWVVGREENCKQISLACVGSTCSVGSTLGLPQLKAACASWVYTAQAPACSARALSEVGPTFHTFPRSKSVRFSCTLQGHNHGLVCILHPSQVRAIQVTRCLASTLSWETVHLNHPPGPSHMVSQKHYESTVSGVLRDSSGEQISGCDSPGRCQL